MPRFLKRILVTLLKLVHENLVYYIKDYLHLRRLETGPGELEWRICRACPNKRIDATGCQIGRELYAFGGYNYSLDAVHDVVDVFDLRRRRWIDSVPTPEGFPQTHNGLTSDGRRFVYAIAGQRGTQCSPAVATSFVFDARERSWLRFPDLPEPRHAPAVILWRGRLHAMGGSKLDRHTPALEHWSIAVEDGRPTETAWRTEPPIPRGGPHRVSVLIDDRVYLFGGQEGDVKAIPGDPDYRCDWDTPEETFFGDTYRLDDPRGEWRQLTSMPVAVSHAEFSHFVRDGKVVIAGGIVDRYTMTDAIQVYDVGADRWEIVGRLPYGLKSSVVGYYDGRFYCATGQRSVGRDDMRHGEVIPSVWRARFSL